VTDQTTPLVPETRVGFADRVLRWCVGAAVRASLLVSARPAALLVRRLFAAGGAQSKQRLDKHAPPEVVAIVDERYGDEDDMLLDIVRPASVSRPLPLVLWVHGGGWVGGAKDELTGYFKLIAHNGYIVAGPRYSLAPAHHYPTPPRQMMQALSYLQANAERFQIDPDRIAVAGDSAGHRSPRSSAPSSRPPVTPRQSVSNPRSLRRSCAASSSRVGRTTWACSFSRARRPPLRQGGLVGVFGQAQLR
jgi:alpha/beta hydrolase fold